MHAPAALEKRDQAVDRGRRKRVAADEQGMEAQGEAQARIAHVGGDQTVDRVITLQAHEVRRELEHVGEGVERLGAQLFERDLVNRLADLHETLVTGLIRRGETFDLLGHDPVAAGAVEHESVVEANPVKRLERT